MRYYKKTRDENNMPRTSIVLKEPVDKECLEYAVRTALPRFKVHRFKVVGDAYRYYLKLNDAPAIVHENDGTRQTVGGGTLPFLKTLLYYYCEKKYEIDRSSRNLPLYVCVITEPLLIPCTI